MFVCLKDLLQQYSHALHKIDQDSQVAERQVIQNFPHDPEAPGMMGHIILQ